MEMEMKNNLINDKFPKENLVIDVFSMEKFNYR